MVIFKICLISLTDFLGILKVYGGVFNYWIRIFFFFFGFQADVEPEVAVAGVPKKRTFKKFSFRGVDLDALLDMSTDELVKLFTARARRRCLYIYI